MLVFICPCVHLGEFARLGELVEFLNGALLEWVQMIGTDALTGLINWEIAYRSLVLFELCQSALSQVGMMRRAKYEHRLAAVALALAPIEVATLRAHMLAVPMHL